MADVPVRRDTYINDPDLFPTELPDGVKKSKDYYAHEVVYEDGRQVLTWYKRGGGGEGGTDQVIDTQTNVLAGIKKEYDAAQARTTPTATSQATAQRDTVTADGRVKQWNPATGKYDIDVGAAGTSAAAATTGPTLERAQQEQVERTRNSQATGLPLTDPEKAAWDVARQKESQATDDRGRAEARQQRLDIEASANRVWSQNLQERQLTGQEAERERAAGVQERQLSGQEAERARVASLQERDQKLQENAPIKVGNDLFTPKRDESGAIVSLEKIQGTGGEAPPDVGALKAELGNVMPELEQRKNQYLQQHQANPTGFTMADVEKALESDRQMAQIRVNEVVGILNAQQNVRSSDITQRAQTLGETQSRRTFADNTATAGLDVIKSLGPALGKQPPGAIDRIIDYVEQKRTGMAERLGGLDLSPEVPHTPVQDALNQIPGSAITPGGGITINIGAGAQAQQSQAQQLAGLTDQVTATTNAMAAPRQPGAADFAMLDPSQFANQTMPQNVDELINLHKKPDDPAWNDAIERAAQGIRNRNRDATPAGAGHQVSGGQLRAPGYSASNGPVGQVGG